MVNSRDPSLGTLPGLTAVLRRVDRAAEQSGRDRSSILVVAVCKGRSNDDVMTAYELGHRDFGENRPEALAARAEVLPADIRWHLVGTVQRRKVKLARPHTFLLHSLDRASLATTWAGVDEVPPALIQVNVAAEPQKHGVDPRDLRALLAVASDAGLLVTGLMTIPPVPKVPEDSAPWFRRLRALRDELAADRPEVVELSMGMTDDFEVAIHEGATIIRVGRAIFEGGRPEHDPRSGPGSTT